MRISQKRFVYISLKKPKTWAKVADGLAGAGVFHTYIPYNDLKHCKKDKKDDISKIFRTDGGTVGRTDIVRCRVACPRLKRGEKTTNQLLIPLFMTFVLPIDAFL